MLFVNARLNGPRSEAARSEAFPPVERARARSLPVACDADRLEWLTNRIHVAQSMQVWAVLSM